MREEGFEQIGPALGAVLDRRNGARKCAGIARAETGNLRLGVLRQRSSVKQDYHSIHSCLKNSHAATSPVMKNTLVKPPLASRKPSKNVSGSILNHFLGLHHFLVIRISL
jgi:hypothetical protein